MEKVVKAVIIEDEPHLREVVAEFLTHCGFEVTVLASGAELHRVIASPPDVVILDLMLPGMSGEQVARRIREAPNCRDVRIVIASAAPDLAANSVRDLADALLAKPFDLEQLLGVIQAVLRRGSP